MGDLSLQVFTLARVGSPKMDADLIGIGRKVKAMEDALKLALEIDEVGLVDFDKYELTCDADISRKYRAALGLNKSKDGGSDG